MTNINDLTQIKDGYLDLVNRSEELLIKKPGQFDQEDTSNWIVTIEYELKDPRIGVHFFEGDPKLKKVSFVNLVSSSVYF